MDKMNKMNKMNKKRQFKDIIKRRLDDDHQLEGTFKLRLNDIYQPTHGSRKINGRLLSFGILLNSK